jgi:hypothetical protein
MYNFYEITTLSCGLMQIPTVSIAAQSWTTDPAAKGTLLGSWHTDIGTIGQLLILRGFATAEDLATERNRALGSSDPFNAASLITALDMSSYTPFPFLPSVVPKSYNSGSGSGAVYEIRTYIQKPGGLPATIKAWEEAIGPAKEYTDHLVINLQALDGPPRIVHIWGFGSVDERMALRKKVYGKGLWPPRGGPENIAEATSWIAVPEEWSPLC